MGKIMILGSLLLLVVCHVGGAKHNILMIIADDMGWNDVSLNNADWDSLNITPKLKNLASDAGGGFAMTNSYVTGRCTPTRTDLLTGKYPYKTGTQNGVMGVMKRDWLPLSETLLPQELQTLGYKTYLVGKWHLGYCKADLTPTKRGFDKFFGFYGSGFDYVKHTTSAVVEGKRYRGYDFWENHGSTFNDVAGIAGVDKVYSTDLFADKAIEYLTEHKSTHGTDTPFFMQLAFNAPHAPLDSIAGYTSPCEGISETGARRKYCDTVAYMDKKIGDVVTFLDEQGLRDNTVIIFTSDNGAVKNVGSNLPFRGDKGSVYEGGTKAITIVNAPKILSNRNVARSELFHVVDWHATARAMANQSVADFENGRDSINQWEWLKTGVVQSNKRVNMVYQISDQSANDYQYALRIGNYKLILESPKTKALYLLSGNAQDDEQTNKYCKRRCDDDNVDYKAQKDLVTLLETLKLEYEPDLGGGYTLEAKPEYFNGSFGFHRTDGTDSNWCIDDQTS